MLFQGGWKCRILANFNLWILLLESMHTDTIILIFCCIPNSGKMRLPWRGLDGTGRGIDFEYYYTSTCWVRGNSIFRSSKWQKKWERRSSMLSDRSSSPILTMCSRHRVFLVWWSFEESDWVKIRGEVASGHWQRYVRLLRLKHHQGLHHSSDLDQNHDHFQEKTSWLKFTQLAKGLIPNERVQKIKVFYSKSVISI